MGQPQMHQVLRQSQMKVLLKIAGQIFFGQMKLLCQGFQPEGFRVVILQISQYLTLHRIVSFGAHRVNGSAGSDFLDK